MDYFFKKENVEAYKRLLKDYDNSYVIGTLKGVLPVGASILELGMGAGLDYTALKDDYKILGTDNSEIFIDDYKMEHPDANVMVMDAVDMDIDESFDCIYSNKVLHHLTKEQFIESIRKQYTRLNNEGIIIMTLWHGEYEEELMFNNSLRLTYYTENDIRSIVSCLYDIYQISRYTEIEYNDSIMVILRKKSDR